MAAANRRILDWAAIQPLRERRFRLYWIGQSVSYLGSAVATVGLTLAIIARTGSAGDLGIVLGATAAAQVVSTLVGGVLADRLPRKSILMAADTVRALSQAVVAIELFSGKPDVGMIAAASALAGAALGTFLPAARGLVPATVDAEHLQQANALVGLSKRVTMMLGPVIATSLFLAAGPGWPVLLDAVTFGVNLLTLSNLRIPHVRREPATFLADLAGGWREVRTRTWLWLNMIVYSVWNLVRCVYFTVGPMVVIGSIGGEVGWATVAQGAAIGALAGALLSLRVSPRRPLVVCYLVSALGALPLILIAVEAPVVMIAAGAGLMSLVLGMTSILDTTIQRHVPPEAISRVSAYGWLVSVGLNPLGMALAGPTALAIGPKATLLGGAAAMAVTCLGALAVRQVRELGPAPVPAGG